MSSQLNTAPSAETTFVQAAFPVAPPACDGMMSREEFECEGNIQRYGSPCNCGMHALEL